VSKKILLWNKRKFFSIRGVFISQYIFSEEPHMVIHKVSMRILMPTMCAYDF
jgi:hypothetical protein